MSDNEEQNDEEIILSEDQRNYILLNFEKKSLMELAKEVSGDPNVKGNHKIGRAIKEFLAKMGAKVKTTKYEAIGELELTEDQKEFCRNNYARMKPLELTRTIFEKADLTPLSRQFKAIYKFLEEIAPNVINKPEEKLVDEEFEPPKRISALVPIVNKYVPNTKKEGMPMYENGRLSTPDERELKALLGSLQLVRFILQANSYNKVHDREIFISSFIGMTYDKPELLREEIEQYISLAAEIVTTTQIERNIQTLENQINETLSGESIENKRLSMTMVELINSAREKIDKSKERQRKLISELIGSRAKRLEGKISANASILNLVEAWQGEETRNKMIKIAERDKEAEGEEIDKLKDMDDVICIIAGITKDEMLGR